MGTGKRYSGYRSYSDLEPGSDFRPFELAAELGRAPDHPVPLSSDGEERAANLEAELVMISLHEHVGVFPDRIAETPDYAREGRMATAFEGLAAGAWDCGTVARHEHHPSQGRA